MTNISKRTNNRLSMPIFIGGMFKSGTSLLRAMIAEHPNISGGLETYWFEIDVEREIARNGEPLDEYLKRLAVFFSISQQAALNIPSKRTSGEAILEGIMEELVSTSGTMRWVEKTPGNLLVADRVFEYWPNASFIHMVRDPRDIYVSFLETREGMTPAKFCDQWIDWVVDGGRRLKALRENGNHILTVHYENLVFDPEITMRNVMEFLDEPWLDSLATFDGNKHDFDVVQKTTGKESPTLKRLAQPMTKERIGVWKSLPEKEMEALINEVSSRGQLPTFKEACFE